MHCHHNELANAADSGGKYRVSVTISGSGLDWHDVASYLQPEGIGQVLVRPRQQDRLQSAGAPVRCRDHDGLQPVSDSSAARRRVPRVGEKKDAAIVQKYGVRRSCSCRGHTRTIRRRVAQLAGQYTLAGDGGDHEPERLRGSDLQPARTRWVARRVTRTVAAQSKPAGNDLGALGVGLEEAASQRSRSMISRTAIDRTAPETCVPISRGASNRLPAAHPRDRGGLDFAALQ